MPSNIPAPRVPMIDPRSGLVNRHWYTFLLNLFDLADAGTNSWTMNDLQQMPPVIPVDTFPKGGIVFWLGTVASIPSGWEEVVALRGCFPRGMASGGTAGATGGSDKHTHGSGGTSTGGGKTSSVGASGGGVSMKDGTGAARTLSLSPHDHDIPEATTLPPYVDGVWIRKL